jgi:four helix bundle protein
VSYKNLEIWQEPRRLVIDIHKMTLEKLPKFELYEEGSQIRKSSKSVKSTIVEGYGRRRYKQEYIRFLTFAIASNDETLDHLENLYETGSLQDKELFENLHDRIEIGRGVLFVMPAKAGIQFAVHRIFWIPAFAGMTVCSSENSPTAQLNNFIKSIEKDLRG